MRTTFTSFLFIVVAACTTSRAQVVTDAGVDAVGDPSCDGWTPPVLAPCACGTAVCRLDDGGYEVHNICGPLQGCFPDAGVDAR